jgi:hypothetical protein
MPDIVIAGREAIADWIETVLLRDRTGSAGNTAIEARAAQEIGAGAAAVGLALTTLERRSQLLGPRYPFEVTQVGIRLREGATTSPYVALLLLTPGGLARQVASPMPTPAMATLFERISCRAMIGLLGVGSRAIRFGWPSDLGRPPEFPAAIRWLAREMHISPGTAFRPPRRKDGGVDVVAWRPFPDGRSGFPVVLVQCTLQQDVVTKANDIDVRNWSGWLTLDANPSTALAVPGTIPADESWNEIAAKSLVLDRIRLVGLLDAASENRIEGLEKEVAILIEAMSDAL